MQKVQVKNWGNSQAIRIPKNVLESLNLEVNSLLELTVDEKNNSIILKIDDGLTPYQRLMFNNQNLNTRKQFIWDRFEEEESHYL